MKNLFSKIFRNRDVYTLCSESEASLKEVKASRRQKTAKIIVGLTLITAMTLTPMSLTACAPKTDTENPNSGVNTPVDPADPNNPTTTNPTDPILQYSQILQDVLKDSTYNTLIDSSKDEYGTIALGNTKFAEIPYGFLSKQGYNVDAIKNGSLKCESTAYLKDGDTYNLYISVKAENNGSVNYYTNYILSYTLTDSEYKDLYMLYEEEYVQAPLFIQELSKQKNASIISQADISVQAYEDLVIEIQTHSAYNSVFTNNNMEVDFLSYSIESQIFNIAVRSSTITNKMLLKDGQLRYVTIKPSLTSGAVFDADNHIFINPAKKGNPTNQSEYTNNFEGITYLTSNRSYTKYNLKEVLSV